MVMELQCSSDVKAGIDLDDYQYLMKFVIIGDYGVGKTCLTRRFAKDEFSEECQPTIGIEFWVRKLILDRNIIKIQMWDTAGQERFRFVTSSYFTRGAHGMILVYDVTNRDSFENIESKWLTELFELSESIKVLVGNRCDLIDGRKVTYSEGKELADRWNLYFLETSAKDGTNVEQVFVSVASEVIKKLKKEKLEQNIPQSNIKLSSNTKVPGNRINICCKIN